MIRVLMRLALSLVMAFLFLGCASGVKHPASPDVLFFVPGAEGDGPWNSGMVQGIVAGGYAGNVEVLDWGAPAPLFMLNLQNPGIHEAAQEKLAARIIQWKLEHPQGRIDIVAHSAGCGVTLGALPWIGPRRQVDHVILLRPSVSPGYDLAPPLGHIAGTLHVFYSDHDTLFLQWRTGTFGTYDNVRTPAAGRTGFTGVATLPPALRARCAQHPYDPAWKSLGDDGGHFGPLAEAFARTILSPLLSR